MRVWITKYALTQGIEEREVETFPNSPNMVKVVGTQHEFYFLPFWHETREYAVKFAEEMRAKKICALERQIKRLEKLEFE